MDSRLARPPCCPHREATRNRARAVEVCSRTGYPSTGQEGRPRRATRWSGCGGRLPPEAGLRCAALGIHKDHSAKFYVRQDRTVVVQIARVERRILSGGLAALALLGLTQGCLIKHRKPTVIAVHVMGLSPSGASRYCSATGVTSAESYGAPLDCGQLCHYATASYVADMPVIMLADKAVT